MRWTGGIDGVDKREKKRRPGECADARRREQKILALSSSTAQPSAFEDRGRQPTEAMSADGQRERPSFALGARVQVVPNGQNRRLWVGLVARRIWHHKHACWTYFIESDGKKVSKRYVAEDLELVVDPASL